VETYIRWPQGKRWAWRGLRHYKRKEGWEVTRRNKRKKGAAKSLNSSYAVRSNPSNLLGRSRTNLFGSIEGPDSATMAIAEKNNNAKE